MPKIIPGFMKNESLGFHPAVGGIVSKETKRRRLSVC